MKEKKIEELIKELGELIEEGSSLIVLYNNGEETTTAIRGNGKQIYMSLCVGFSVSEVLKEGSNIALRIVSLKEKSEDSGINVDMAKIKDFIEKSLE